MPSRPPAVIAVPALWLCLRRRAAPAGRRSAEASASCRICFPPRPIWAATFRDLRRTRASRRSSTDGSPISPARPRSIRRSVPSPSTTTNRRRPTPTRSRCSRTSGAATTLSVAYVGNRYLNLRNNLNLNPVATGRALRSGQRGPDESGEPAARQLSQADRRIRNDQPAHQWRLQPLQLAAGHGEPARPLRADVRVGLHAWPSPRARPEFRTSTIWPTPTTTHPATGGTCCRSTGSTRFRRRPGPPACSAPLLDNWQVAVVAGFTTGAPESVTFTTTDNFDFTGGGDAGRVSVDARMRSRFFPGASGRTSAGSTRRASSARRAAATKAIRAVSTTSAPGRTPGTSP